jgi:hypothetical protein
MSDSTDRDMQRADIANGEGNPDDAMVPPEQDPEAGYPTSTGVVEDDAARGDNDEGRLPPPGQELEAD